MMQTARLYRVTAPITVFATGADRDEALMHAVASVVDVVLLSPEPHRIERTIGLDALTPEEQAGCMFQSRGVPVPGSAGEFAWMEAINPRPLTEAEVAAAATDPFLEAAFAACTEPRPGAGESEPEGIPGLRMYRFRHLLRVLAFAFDPRHAFRIAAEAAPGQLLAGPVLAERITHPDHLTYLESYMETVGPHTITPGRFVAMEQEFQKFA